jgi:hypothetical protein
VGRTCEVASAGRAEEPDEEDEDFVCSAWDGRGDRLSMANVKGIVRWDRGVEMKKDADLLSSDVMA